MGENKFNINTSPPADVTIFDRTTSNKIEITEDKLRLKLIPLKDSLENKSAIFSYLGILLTILLALLTSNFKDLVLPSVLWKAIFIVGLVISTLRLGLSIYRYIKCRKNIDDIIIDIKKKESNGV